MTILVLIGVGGAVGSMMRYLVGLWVQSAVGNFWIPYGTLTVNVLGCFMIGLVAGLAETHELLSDGARALIVVGLLGGFTTFSTFGYETMALVREGHTVMAAANVGLQIALGLTAVSVGFKIAQ